MKGDKCVTISAEVGGGSPGSEWIWKYKVAARQKLKQCGGRERQKFSPGYSSASDRNINGSKIIRKEVLLHKIILSNKILLQKQVY